MRGNFFKCANWVLIEGQNVGSFESIEVTEDRDSLSNTCTLTLPLYAIGRDNTQPAKGVRASLKNAQIMVGARIDVFTWYEEVDVLQQEFEKVLQFSGYIKEVVEGFPLKLICEDHSFVLRFGSIGKDWPGRTKLKDMINHIIPIANKAFTEFRQKKGFKQPDNFVKLTFDSTNSAEVEFQLSVYNKISPFDALMKLMKLYTLYANASPEGKLYFGLGVRDKFKRTVKLATNANVIDRDLIPKNGLFENYKVVVSAMLKDGTKYTYELGDSEGEAKRVFMPINTKEGIKNFAEALMAHLKGSRNKGTITTILYPEIHLFDYINYTDTIFPSLSGNFYCIGRKFKGDTKTGYTQTITVTDEIFML
jgi:hypothetical protein